MCGFAGVVSRAPLSAAHAGVLARMSAALRHRGPDDEGFAFLGGESTSHYRGDDTVAELGGLPHVSLYPQGAANVGLASRRLAILDLSVTGHMPMRGPRGTCIAYNGEIYNYRELRAELETAGHRFHSSSDTEVLLAAYAQWGTEALHRLNGMWAFALWDPERRVLFCARDRFGEKQIYFTRDAQGNTWVASEIRPLFQPLGGVPEPDDALIWDFLLYGLADHSEQTMFAGISQLLPGQAMEIAPGGQPRVWQWYSLPRGSGGDCASLEQNQERLRGLLADSVKLRLRSDVPVASFLSGGLDSSSIVSLADQALLAMNGTAPQPRLRTYTNAYPDGHPYDESPLVRKALERFRRVDPVFIQADVENFERDLLQLVVTQEQPFHNVSIFASYNLLRLIRGRDRIKVVLTGEAGDELLAGYWRVYLPLHLASTFSSLRLREWAREASCWGWKTSLTSTAKGHFRSLPRAVRNRLQRFRNPVAPVLCPEFFREHGERDEAVMEQWRRGSLEERLAADVTRFNLPQLLRHLDRNAMHFSIETRVPFLDHRLVEFALSLPAGAKLHGGYTKLVLRGAMQSHLPPEIAWNRRKLGFGMAEQFWFARSAEMLREGGRLERYVDVKRLKAGIRRGGEQVSQSYWMPVSLGLWLAAFYEGN